MGQYYVPLLIDDKKKSVKAFSMNGLKIMEHAWFTNDMEAIVQHLHTEKRVLWMGDYADAENGEWIATSHFKGERWDELLGYYNLAYGKDKKRPVKPKWNNNHAEYSLLIDDDRKEYVPLDKYVKANSTLGWLGTLECIHPLPLLTACGNGCGGGDYEGSDMQYVGSWAGDHIYAGVCVPDGYKPIVPHFVESIG